MDVNNIASQNIFDTYSLVIAITAAVFTITLSQILSFMNSYKEKIHKLLIYLRIERNKTLLNKVEVEGEYNNIHHSIELCKTALSIFSHFDSISEIYPISNIKKLYAFKRILNRFELYALPKNLKGKLTESDILIHMYASDAFEMIGWLENYTVRLTTEYSMVLMKNYLVNSFRHRKINRVNAKQNNSVSKSILNDFFDFYIYYRDHETFLSKDEYDFYAVNFEKKQFERILIMFSYEENFESFIELREGFITSISEEISLTDKEEVFDFIKSHISALDEVSSKNKGYLKHKKRFIKSYERK